jgi:hypothetical protein
MARCWLLARRSGAPWLVESLGHRQHRRIDETDIGIGIAITNLANSPIVGWPDGMITRSEPTGCEQPPKTLHFTIVKP